MSAAATRDDLAAVVTALTKSAQEQRRWQAEYEAKAADARRRANARRDAGQSTSDAEEWMWMGFSRQARGTATGYEVAADMINKYVGVQP